MPNYSTSTLLLFLCTTNKLPANSILSNAVIQLIMEWHSSVAHGEECFARTPFTSTKCYQHLGRRYAFQFSMFILTRTGNIFNRFICYVLVIQFNPMQSYKHHQPLFLNYIHIITLKLYFDCGVSAGIALHILDKMPE